MRALAATLVVVEHAAYVSNGYDPGTDRLIYFGRIGVILFFAISGFVIALQRTRRLDEFVKHRALRIYPSYWLAMDRSLDLDHACKAGRHDRCRGAALSIDLDQ